MQHSTCARRRALNFVQVGVGHSHACGLTSSDRRAYCWGVNSNGQLGDGTTTFRFTPVPVVGGLHFSQISVNGDNTCGVTTDSIGYCWGNNDFGQVGDSTSVAMRLRPSRVSGTHHFRQISAGIGHTCAVTPTNGGYCWGYGRLGELGNGKTYLSFWPRRVSGELSLRRVSAGWSYTCAETTNSRAYCWGYLGNDIHLLTPTSVPGGFSFAQLSTGWLLVYGKTPGGALYFWGGGSFTPTRFPDPE